VGILAGRVGTVGILGFEALESFNDLVESLPKIMSLFWFLMS